MSFSWFVSSQTINKQIPLHPTTAREAGATIIEKTNNLQRTTAREAGETSLLYTLVRT
jgi:hypothetical protein